MNRNIRHFVCVYFPRWAIAVASRKKPSPHPQPGERQDKGTRKDCSLREEPSKRPARENTPSFSRAILLVAARHQQMVVHRACSVASSYGVREGMTLALAKATLPHAFHSGARELVILPFDPRGDMRTLYKLAVWCTAFSPLVGIEQEVLRAFRDRTLETLSPLHEGIILEVTGSARVHGGFENLLARMQRAFTTHGIEARCALAPTIGAAWALSRFGDLREGEAACRIVLEPTYIRETLAPLPVAALRLPHATLEALEELGIATIAALCKLPRKQLGVRCGVHVLTRLDQAFGAVDEPLRAVRPPTHYSLRRRFEVPLLTRESVHHVIEVLLERLLASLVARKRAARSFLIRVEGRGEEGDTRTVTREVALLSVHRNRKALRSVLQPVIEELVFPQGVHTITVLARSTTRVEEGQREYIESGHNAEAQEQRAELVNNLVVRLGPERVCGVAFANSYIPERAFAYRALGELAREGGAPTPALTTSERPSYLLSVPEAIEALSLLPDKPPSMMTWRGTRYRIVKGIGPERIAHEWWHTPLKAPEMPPSSEGTRDYFKVQDHTGRWLWVFRENPSMEWFVHGVWQWIREK